MPLPTPTLTTPRLHLRPITEADAPALYPLHSNPHILRYWNSPPWTDPAQATAFIARSKAIESEATGARLAITLSADHRFIGWCNLVQWNPTHRSAKLGYLLADTEWGHGYATEAARALLAWAFAALPLNRVQAEIDTRNPASGRVLTKLGFRLEGTLRQDCIVNGEISDSHIYGLLRADWIKTAP